MIHFAAAVLLNVQSIVYPAGSEPVVLTVADLLRDELFADATVRPVGPGEPIPDGAVLVSIGLDPRRYVSIEPDPDGPWMFGQVDQEGKGVVTASEAGFLFALYERVKATIRRGDLDSLASGIYLRPQFEWITGREDVHMSRLHYLKRRSEPVSLEDIEASFREAARLGCTHVIVNEPTSPHPYETGPDGEIYYRFYAYALDLDQYVETKLNAGTYPADLLESNLTLMKQLATLATKYGLTPGMYIANPRSVPESLLDRYPYLRGARIDHTYRAFEPRYTLTLAHPAVRWHYAEMLRKLLAEVPELGFLITLVNDSGSGFEYTASLYPGRNGGPYVVREWRPDDEIARKAAENVIRYYRLMRDTGREINPEFRLLTGLKNIAEEAEIILDGLDDGIDLRMRSQRSDYNDDWFSTMDEFRARGSEMTGQALAKGNPIIIGVPAPWQVGKSLADLHRAGYRHVGLDMDPVFLSQYDVNREVLAAFQLGGEDAVEPAIVQFAGQLAEGQLDAASKLIEVWRLTDEAVAATPRLALYGGQGFVWYRFWVRPFVPDIAKIPDEDRAYYQDYFLSVFNNPHNVDFGADALWTIHSAAESERFVTIFDEEVWTPLDKAISLADRAAAEQNAPPVFAETRDRLHAYRSYARTLRNMAAWIAGVHGYLDAESESEKGSYRAMVTEMVADELENTRELLELWESSDIDFIPITEGEETMHTYGLNFPELLRKKIFLMEAFGDAEPYIDPNYMWRMPPGSELSDEEYLGY